MEEWAMESFNRLKEYSKTVCEQIRWKKAHGFITEEIENHIIDQRDAYIGQGMSEDQAMDETISQMGDPVNVGVQLDNTHKPKSQWGMISLTAMLLFLGLFINAYLLKGTSAGNLAKILPSMILGMGLMSIFYLLDFTFIGRYPRLFYCSILVLTAVTMILSPKYNGRVYYAMYFVLLFPVAFAAIIYWARNRGYIGIFFCGLAFVVLVAISQAIPTDSGFVMFAISGIVLLTMASLKNWFKINKNRNFRYVLVYIPIISTFCFAAIKFIMSPYRLRRIEIAINPEIDPVGWGWQSIIARNLLDNSKFIGSGTILVQNSGTQHFPLPGIHTDFMLTYLIFKIGWIGFVLVLALFMFFIITGFMHCLKQKSILGSLVSTAVMMTFTLQVIGYVISNLGLQLLTPISMPLISFGGTATIINLILIGIMLSVFKSGDIVRDKNIIRVDKERCVKVN
jgi:cell division protein FtsW (lipid II flippase)